MTWRHARTIPDLGALMARWLEGDLPSWPGYDGPLGQEEDDVRHLVAPLAALCRAGMVTTGSQPAADRPGWDGARWRQRAWVTGIVPARSPLLARLHRLQDHGLVVVHGRPDRPVPLTDRDGHPTLALPSRRPGRDHLAHEWAGLHRQALTALRHGTTVHVIDPTWGRDDRLWPALQHAARLHTAVGGTA